jgi:hypothetical protein
MTVLSAADRAAFMDTGFVRVRGAFDGADAASMRDVIWTHLERRGIRRDDASTWTDEAPSHLQPLKAMACFRAIGTERTIDAIDDLLGADTWDRPPNWGAFFLTFPAARPWTVPTGPWHIDAPYTDPLAPLHGLKVHALLGDIAPRAGGMTVLEGSHRAVARFAEVHPPEPATTMARMRKALLRSDPWFRELTAPGGDPSDRIARFVDSTAEVLGVPVRVTELTADAGDVILIHPLLLHARPTNAGTRPRFLLNKDLRTRTASWAVTSR